jgi:hypothetical protein
LKPDFAPARESLAQCIELRDQSAGKRHRAHRDNQAKPEPAANPDNHQAKADTAPEAQVKGLEKSQTTATTSKSQTHRAKRKRTKT